ncbi:MAG: M48 family metallopeptidase [Candidatus Omnitrophica bacterium]|nr:M48 family metallopeptidase [Candidatus Omnitrophota bacterium]
MSKESDAKRYARLRRGLWFADLLLGVLLLGLWVFSGAAVFYRDWVVSHLHGWPLQVGVYIGSLGAGMSLVAFPLDWIRDFWLEHRFGLSTLTFPRWMLDQAKQWLLGGLLGLAVVEGLSALLRFAPENWWGWAAFFWLGWSILLTRVAPTWLIPIFYRQTPLKEAALKQRLESLLNRCQTRVRGIFEVNLSRTTRKANACLCGLGKSRRVLISDTLLKGHPPEEVEVILAHEVGHLHLHHMGILIGASGLATGALCFLADRGIRFLLGPLSLTGLDDLAALPLLGLLFTGLSLVWMPFINGLSRILEAQADRYALDQTGNPRAFATAMRRLAERNLAEASPPKWVEWLLYDHPSIAKRIAMAEGADA